MMNTLKGFSLFLCLLCFAQFSVAQEEAPVKIFNYTISLSHLKTESQASIIQEEVSKIDGVSNCKLILTEYSLSFTCSNHDMSKYFVMDRVKEIISREGVQIVIINRADAHE